MEATDVAALRLAVLDSARDVRGLVDVTSCAGAARVLSTWWRGERMLFHAAFAAPAASDGDGVEAGPLSLRGTAGGNWELRHATADAELAVDWAPAGPPLAWDLPTTPALRREERAGTASGRLVVRGERIDLDGAGVLETESGPHRAVALDAWFACRVFGGAGEHAIAAIATIDGRDHVAGQVVRGGEAVPVERAELLVAHAYHAGPPALGELTITTGDGSNMRVGFARGAVFSTVDPVGGRLVARHVGFPVVTLDGSAATGALDAFAVDAEPQRAHIAVSGVAGAAR